MTFTLCNVWVCVVSGAMSDRFRLNFPFGPLVRMRTCLQILMPHTQAKIHVNSLEYLWCCALAVLSRQTRSLYRTSMIWHSFSLELCLLYSRRHDGMRIINILFTGRLLTFAVWKWWKLYAKCHRRFRFTSCFLIAIHTYIDCTMYVHVHWYIQSMWDIEWKQIFDSMVLCVYWLPFSIFCVFFLFVCCCCFFFLYHFLRFRFFFGWQIANAKQIQKLNQK